MKMNKKLLAGAVAGTLMLSGSAFATGPGFDLYGGSSRVQDNIVRDTHDAYKVLKDLLLKSAIAATHGVAVSSPIAINSVDRIDMGDAVVTDDGAGGLSIVFTVDEATAPIMAKHIDTITVTGSYETDNSGFNKDYFLTCTISQDGADYSGNSLHLLEVEASFKGMQEALLGAGTGCTLETTA